MDRINTNYYYLIIIIPITLFINKKVHPIQIIPSYADCQIVSTFFVKIAVTCRH